jgi:hypothetical protein
MLYRGGGDIKIFAKKQLLIGLILYYTHFFLSKYSSVYIHTSFRWYLGDLLSLIVCVQIFINIQIALKIRSYKTNIAFDIFFYFVIFSVYYEIILPMQSKLFTSDVFDIICYFISGIILFLSLYWMDIKVFFVKFFIERKIKHGNLQTNN